MKTQWVILGVVIATGLLFRAGNGRRIMPGAERAMALPPATPTPAPVATLPPQPDQRLPDDVPWSRMRMPSLPALNGVPVGMCPVVAAVQGSITTTNPSMAYRLFRNQILTTCAMSKPFPGVTGPGTYHYAEHWFTNSSGVDRCYTVDVTQACVGTNYIFLSTYLNSFNAPNLETNYLADIGERPSPTGAYAFTVPAGSDFGIIVNEQVSGVGCDSYAFTLKECGCWDVTVSGSITTTDASQAGHLFRDETASTCRAPKVYPGFLTSAAIHYDTYTFKNVTSQSACYQVELDAPVCTGTHFIFASAYLGAYNPGDPGANYLADLGSSPNLQPGVFSFNVPAGQDYTLVVNEVTSNAGCPDYTLRLMNCGAQVCLPLIQR